MSKNIPITVLMCVYNGATYLQESIDSILKQSLTDFEFIIIDDASTDRTPEILKSNLDPRIKVVTNIVNIGLTKSLNIGLKLSNGTYIARMDSDDISLQGRLQEQKDFLDRNKGIVCVGSEIDVIDYNGEKIGSKTQSDDPYLIKFFMIFKNQIVHSSVMFVRDKIMVVGGYNESFKYAQDYDLWSRLILNKYHISNIKKPLVKYRMHNQSITQGERKDDAYSYAQTTTWNNICRYVELSESNFKILMQSINRHKVDSFSSLIVIFKAIERVRKSFLSKESLNSKQIDIITSYCTNLKYNSIRWYIKDNFKFIYSKLIRINGLIKKIK